MKKLINISFIYAILGMISGIFYREFTKIIGFTGKTALAFTHLHLFVLGMFLFLILALFALNTNLVEHKKFKSFLILYNIGLPFTVIMLYCRGITEVLELSLSTGLNAAISGFSGIAHIILGIAIIILFLSLKNIKIINQKK